MIGTKIAFGDEYSSSDFKLILSKVEIPPAKPKTNYIDIPGGDGSLDLTEASGEVKYYDRDCKFTFTMNPTYNISEALFEEKKTEVSNALNGRVFKIALSKDPDYYYEGRCSVSEYLSDKMLKQIVITARTKPYKLSRAETIIKQQLSATDKEIKLINGRMPVVPEIICEGGSARITCGNIEKVLNEGTHKILDFRLKQGVHNFVISGSGSITFKYRQGEL